MKIILILFIFMVCTASQARPNIDSLTLHQQLTGKWECNEILHPAKNKKTSQPQQKSNGNFTIRLRDDYFIEIMVQDSIICTTNYKLKNKLGKCFFYTRHCEPGIPLRYQINDGIVQIDGDKLRINCAYNDRGYIYIFTKVIPPPTKRFRWLLWWR